MWVFPLGAALVSGYFSGLLGVQWWHRRRPNLAAWSVALAMFGVASAAAAVGLLAGWSAATFRIYYLFGAIVNVPVLALGTIYLLAPRALGHVCALLLAIAVVYAASAVMGADLLHQGLATSGIPRGSEVMPGSVRSLSRYYSIVGFLIVVGGALWSALRLARGHEPQLKRLAVANLLIAGGTTIVAAASELARIAQGSIEGSIFAVGLFAGVSVMFLGFLRTRPPRPV
jgi:hypothetical protein